MARTAQQLDAELLAAQNSYPELAALTSPSATALHRLWRYVVRVCMQVLETNWDRHRADVDAIVARAPAGTTTWYADRAKEFQKDDGSLAVLPNGAIGYATVDLAARIITQATAKENALSGKLFLKLAKDGPTAGTLAALSAAELVQARGYFAQRGFAGVRLEIVSRDADRLQVAGNVYYNPLLDVATVQAGVVTAVQQYLASLDFDGLVYVTRLTDAIQAVPGVRDVAPLVVSARVGAALPVPFARVYETAAGYIVPDELPGATLLDTLQFLPDGQ